jgi:hypothetical protein
MLEGLVAAFLVLVSAQTVTNHPVGHNTPDVSGCRYVQDLDAGHGNSPTCPFNGGGS